MASEEMVYSTCAEWVHEMTVTHPMPLVDAWDFNEWMTTLIKDATDSFLETSFHSVRARNDALLCLRALFWEHYKWQELISQQCIKPNPESAARLLATPSTPQKTTAWFAESYDLLTGHEFGALVVGSPAELQAAIAKKAAPRAVYSTTPQTERIVFKTPEDGKLSPFQWGWRFEPVARLLYEAIYAGGSVNDSLGRVRHPKLPRLAASPDGLIVSGARSGRLVELKCPITRVLDYTVPYRYYCQMQLQAEVCDVDAVDYFEACFAVKDCNTIKYLDITLHTLEYIGKLCVTVDSDNIPNEYYYSPLFPATERGLRACQRWLPDTNDTIVESVIWWVKDSYNTVVQRNPRWWSEIGYPAYIKYWLEVDKARLEKTHAPKALFIEESEEELEEEPLAYTPKPLFIDDEEQEVEGATVHRSAETAETAGDCKTAVDDAIVATDAGISESVE